MLLVFYALILVAVVMLGAHINKAFMLNHKRMQLVMSFVSGVMLGIAAFHLLPHALYGSRGIASIDYVMLWLMAGLLSMFLLQRLLHFHHHDFAGDADLETGADQTSIGAAQQPATAYKNQYRQGAIPRLSASGGVGVFIGLAIHSLIDGVALGASMLAATSEHAPGLSFASLAGFGVFLAILMHKPLDALAIASFLDNAGVRKRLRWMTVLAYALLCPAATALVISGFSVLSSSGVKVYIVAALAYSAGIFLCIALSDLLPEIHFHNHDRFKMTALLLLGIAVSLLLKQVESTHSHELILSDGPERQPGHYHQQHIDE